MNKDYKAPEIEQRQEKMAHHNFVYLTDVADMIAGGHKVLITAKGWSMLPMIWDSRDKLLLAPPSENSFTVGRLLFVRLSSMRYILHRLEDVDGERLILRGDGNPYQREECDRSEVIGELIAVERAGEMIMLGSEEWDYYTRFWPKNAFLRRCLLYAYKKLFIPAKALFKR